MIITQDYFPKIRSMYKDKTIVYCSGSFDLTHARHILFLSRCKAKGDILVVGVGTDGEITNEKGNGRPIFNEDIRLYTVDNLKSVDYSCLNTPPELGTHRLSKVKDALLLLKPDIYAIIDDAYDIPYRRRIAKQSSCRLEIIKRNENIPPYLYGISTTEIIKTVIQRAGPELQLGIWYKIGNR